MLYVNYTNGRLSKAQKYTQDELLISQTKEESDKPVLVTQLNPSNPDIRKQVLNNWNIIENTEELNQVFKDKPIIG